jgi:transglutaminase-like putative cysteine protease
MTTVQYNIRHVTRFIYDSPITESVMEARVQPRSEGAQRCMRFSLSTTPIARVRMYQDHDGNLVHHFNIPGRLSRLSVVADALVECAPAPDVPAALGPGAWERLEAATASGAFWEVLHPSPFARPTARLDAFARELDLRRGDDPLATVRRINSELFARLTYSPKSTRVDSPIDDALESRKGVCQDFTHIMIALLRHLGIPCRYVSGYLFHQADGAVRSADGATHAWGECWFPELGWIGFDPTNNLVADHRHIRVAIGRDYTDVPPTRGVFKGLSAARSELSVAVRVGTNTHVTEQEVPTHVPWVSREVPSSRPRTEVAQQPQQQQQQ